MHTLTHCTLQRPADCALVMLNDPVLKKLVGRFDGQYASRLFNGFKIGEPRVVGGISDGLFEGRLRFLPDFQEIHDGEKP